MSKRKLYIGWCPFEQRYRVFRSAETPTQETHGAFYSHVTGPFRTLKAAHVMIDGGRNNPHTQTVAECEAIAKHS